MSFFLHQKLENYQNNHTLGYKYLRNVHHLSHSLWRVLSGLLPAAGGPWAVLVCPGALTLAFSDAWKLCEWITSLILGLTNAYWYCCRLNILIKTIHLCILNIYMDVSKASAFPSQLCQLSFLTKEFSLTSIRSYWLQCSLRTAKRLHLSVSWGLPVPVQQRSLESRLGHCTAH